MIDWIEKHFQLVSSISSAILGCLDQWILKKGKKKETVTKEQSITGNGTGITIKENRGPVSVNINASQRQDTSFVRLAGDNEIHKYDGKIREIVRAVNGITETQPVRKVSRGTKKTRVDMLPKPKENKVDPSNA
jgi:hypothetical protein